MSYFVQVAQSLLVVIGLLAVIGLEKRVHLANVTAVPLCMCWRCTLATLLCSAGCGYSSSGTTSDEHGDFLVIVLTPLDFLIVDYGFD